MQFLQLTLAATLSLGKVFVAKCGGGVDLSADITIKTRAILANVRHTFCTSDFGGTNATIVTHINDSALTFDSLEITAFNVTETLVPMILDGYQSRLVYQPAGDGCFELV